MGKVLVADANPGVASWNPSGIATVANGQSQVVVTGLDAGLVGHAVLLSFASVPAGVASAVGVLSLDAPTSTATLTITTYDGVGVAAVTSAPVDVAYLVLA